jgi:hypothetical protein
VGRTGRCGCGGSGTCAAAAAWRRGPPPSPRGSLPGTGRRGTARRAVKQHAKITPTGPRLAVQLSITRHRTQPGGPSPQMMSVASSMPGTRASSVSHTRSNCATLYSRFMASSTASLPDWTCARREERARRPAQHPA